MLIISANNPCAQPRNRLLPRAVSIRRVEFVFGLPATLERGKSNERSRPVQDVSEECKSSPLAVNFSGR